MEERTVPAVLTVNGTADNTAADNMLTLREAIQLVDGTLGRALTAGEQAQVSGSLGSSDTIQFNLPAGPQTITLSGGMLSIIKPVAINGPGAAGLTINGNSLDRDFVVGQIWSKNLSLVASITGLTITGGKQTYGAGVLNFGTLTINNCVVANNAAGTSGGGGIYNVGALTLTSTTLTGNSTGPSTNGGGLYNISGATATATNCTFGNNVAGGTGSSGSQGGGLFNSGTITVTGCTFNANTAGSDAGAFYTDGTATVSTCSFTNNYSGADGGGIHATGALTITGCLVAGNTASSSGGGMEESGIVGSVPNSLTMTNTTFINNTAYGTAGGLVNWTSAVTLVNDTFTGNRAINGASGTFGGGIWAPTSLTLRDTIVAGNFRGAAPGTTANDIAGSVKTGSSYNLIGTGGAGGLSNGSNHNLVGVANPKLGPLASNGGPTQTVALLAGSPAIDAGDDSVLQAPLSLTTDQRGLPRLSGSHVDIGAFEFQVGATSAPAITSAAATTLTAGSAGSFTVTTTGSPTPALTEAGSLPAGITFTDNGNGTATLAGTPAAGTGKVWTFTITASNGVSPNATQTFTLTVNEASAITSAAGTPFTAGSAGSFTVTTTGFPAAALTEAGALPSGVTFKDNGDGTATLSGTPAGGSAGTYTLTFKAHNGVGSDATQTFTLTVNPPAQAVLTVDSTADNTTPDNVLTLREAIELVDGTLGRALTAGEQAQVSGTLGTNNLIQFSLPTGPQTITLTQGELDLTQPVTIAGPGAANLTIGGNGASRVFTVGQIWSPNPSLTVALSGLTVANGSALAGNDYGAGLLNFGTLTLSNMAFTGNAAGSHGGGALYNVGALTVSNSTFASDTTAGGDGAAIDNISSGTLTVTGCTFTGNSAGGGGQGGGIANSGTATVSGCTFSGNSAGSNGGGLFNSQGGTLTLRTSTVANNTCGSDGGGLDQDGTATVTACTLSGNSAASEGGGMDNKGTLLGLINCTLYGNSAATDGGGLTTSGAATVVNCTITANRVTSGVGGGLDDQGTAAKLSNTIVAGNFQGAAPSTTADDIAGSVDAGSSYNLVGTGGSGGLVSGSNHNLVGVTNPGLGALASNGGPTQTVALLAGSPALDAGDDSVLGPPLSLTTDQRGLPRLSGNHVDIGAFELQVAPAGPAVTATSAIAGPSAAAQPSARSTAEVRKTHLARHRARHQVRRTAGVQGHPAAGSEKRGPGAP